MKVVLIGSGNVATVLGKKIVSAGNQVVQVVGRSLVRAQLLSSVLKANATDSLAKINKDADIYIIAVADNFVGDIAFELQVNNKLVVHTAGAITKDILKNLGGNYGVLYPLQSLRKEMMRLPDIPILIDGNSAETIKVLTDFSKEWAKSVYRCTDEERLKLHVAAVMASNFTNHLYTLAEYYCKEEHLQFDMLLPLITETAQRIEDTSPSQLQTGPAVRGDLKTIQKHQGYLKNYRSVKLVYDVLTKSIVDNKKLGEQ